MAKSKAKKLREKMEREGKLNPDLKRSPFVFADMRTRTTKTKKIAYTKTSTRTIIPLKEEMVLFILLGNGHTSIGKTSIIEQFVLQYFVFKLI